MERVPPQGAPGACGGPCFCVDFAFLAWPCTGSPKVPMPDAPDDPTESGIAGAADKLETMLRRSHPSVNIFFQPTILARCRRCGFRQN